MNEELKEQLLQAVYERIDSGETYHGMTYEEGIRDILNAMEDDEELTELINQF